MSPAGAGPDGGGNSPDCRIDEWIGRTIGILACAALTPADGLPVDLLDFSIDSDGATGAAKGVEPETTDEEPAD